MTNCVMVWTTLGDEANAAAMARTLVTERLAACVSVHAPMESIYRWKDGIEQDRERQVVIKTTTSRLASLAARLRELHPYDVPEFLVTPVVEGGDDYLAWLEASVEEP